MQPELFLLRKHRAEVRSPKSFQMWIIAPPSVKKEKKSQISSAALVL